MMGGIEDRLLVPIGYSLVRGSRLQAA